MDNKEGLLQIDFDSIKDGFFAVSVDPGASQSIATAVLSFPKGTTVTVRGDKHILKQIIERLDKLVIEYEV